MDRERKNKMGNDSIKAGGKEKKIPSQIEY